MGFTSIGGPIYLSVAVVMNAIFCKGAFDILRRDRAAADPDGFAVEKSFFKFSLLYLFLHFGALLGDAALRSAGLWGGF